jgi:outer membrane protein, heavy metal efflux system
MQIALLVLLAAEPLGLDDVLRDVAANAPARQVRAADVDLARAEVGMAGAWQDPELRFRVEEISFAHGRELEPLTTWQLDQRLELFGRRRAAKSAARARVDASQEFLRRSEWDARAGAVSLFHEIWMSDEMRRVLDEQIAAMERMRASAMARYAAGLMMVHHDVLRADAEIAAMRAEAFALERERDGMVGMLNTLRGVPLLQPIDSVALPARREVPPSDDAVSLAGSSPEVAAAAAMVREMEARQSLARRMYLPMVMVGAMVEQSPDPMMGTTYGAEISLSVPLWAFDRQRNEVRAARAMLRRAETDQRAMSSMSAAEARMAWARAAGADRELRAIEETALPRMREAVTSSQAAYAAGTESFLPVLEAILSLQDLEGVRLEAVVRREVALFELSRVSGAALGEKRNP